MISILPQTKPPSLTTLTDPITIPDLGLWLAGDFGVMNSVAPNIAATNGQPCRRWLDQSGNGRHFEQSTAVNQPVLNTTGIGSKPALDFDGVNDLMEQSAGLDLIKSASGATFFAIIKPHSATYSGIQTIFLIQTGSASTRVSLARDNTPAVRIGGRRLDDEAFDATEISTTTATTSLFTCRTNYTAATMEGWKDGGEKVTNASFQTAGYSSPNNSAAICVGGNGSAGGFEFPGLIAEILVWPRALTDSETWRVHRYLSLKYGIALNV
jgi:hypothetical protein